MVVKPLASQASFPMRKDKVSICPAHPGHTPVLPQSSVPPAPVSAEYFRTGEQANGFTPPSSSLER